MSRRPFLPALLLIVSGQPAQAGIRALYTDDWEKRTEILVADNGDIDAELEEGRRLLVRNGEAFIIEDRLTGPLVARLADVEALAAEAKAAPSAQATSDDGYRLIGSRTVNGRTGTAFLPAWAVARGSDEKEDSVIVVSDDPSLAPLAAAMRQVERAEFVLARIESQGPPASAEAKAGFFRLLEGGAPLKMGSQVLLAAETRPIPPEGMALPAEAETRQALRARLARESAPEEGGRDSVMISRAAFADGRLWLLTDKGALSSIREDGSHREREAGSRRYSTCAPVRPDSPRSLGNGRGLGACCGDAATGGSRLASCHRAATAWSPSPAPARAKRL